MPRMANRMGRAAALAAATVLTLALTACSDDGGDEGTATDDTGGTTSSTESPSGERTHEPQPENPDGAPCAYEATGTSAKPVEPPADTAAYSGSVAVTIETSVGDLQATLDAASAPCTVNSFTSLASQGYFDDTTCHRLTTAGIFVLQCGDPTATGTGGPGYQFDDELDGSETYPAGTLAMANAGPGTNGSQFFVVYEDTPLPPSYTVFGSVDESSVGLVADVAADGTNNQNGQGDGAPNTPVDIEFVEVGQASPGTTGTSEAPSQTSSETPSPTE
jgi:peptidyl-prolyl cis-trans isomerase B (cyclophilin B)